MTVGMRLALGFGLVLAMLVGLTATGIQEVNFVDDTLTRITEVNAVKQRYAINFRGSVHDRAIALRDATLVRDQTELAAVLAEIERLSRFYAESAEALDRLLAAEADGERAERAILAGIKEIEARALPLVGRVLAEARAGERFTAQTLLLDEAGPALSEWLVRINQFIDHQEDKNQAATASARTATKRFAWLMVVLCGVALAVSVLVAWRIIHGLKSTLGGEPDVAAGVVTRIAAGDLASPVDAARPGSMLAAVAGMQDKLATMFREMVELASALSDKAYTVGEASRAAQAAARRQAELSSATAAGIEQMTTSIADVSQVARRTEDNSARTSALSQEGVALVESAAAEMARISTTVLSSLEMIRRLQQRSEEIGSVAGAIDEIADQTNLLALNAAIEAARAGESGRGFAVVADEVRTLAGRTGQATAEIAQMIEQIRADTRQAVSAMETAAPQVEKGLALANQASAMLGEIHSQAASSLEHVHEVARATGEQAAAAAGISGNVEQIATMSGETSRAMEHSTRSAEELERISARLKDYVGRFRLK
ncbi:methyl-accepting chemotaxis protein [Pseudothauera nasutitermitis]|nr:methyl-accepting chemotaxis protein [Pseudothauera nasutitermitis]